MLKKRIVIALTFLDGVLYRTKKFIPDYRYTKNFIDFASIDEIIIIDISKKKLQNPFIDIVNEFVLNCNVPLAVGGGIKNIDHASFLLNLGIEKIVLNSSSYDNLNLINEVAMKHGSQSIVHSIDIIKQYDNYKVMFNNNSIESGSSLDDWISILNDKPIGEILFNFIDNDGSLMGYNINLLEKIEDNINFPYLVLGGCGNWSHVLDLFTKTQASAACTQNIYHFSFESITSLKKYLLSNGIKIRN